jgi:hypothetical protein
MNLHIPFPDIGQFRSVVKAVRDRAQYVGVDDGGEPQFDRTLPLPTLEFKGTVKLHGTNAAIGHNIHGDLWFQSRERLITPADDNAGFAAYASGLGESLNRLFSSLLPYSTAVVYGEWCGCGIQKGVAVSQLPKMFVVFSAYVDGVWRHTGDWKVPLACGVFSVDRFPQFQVAVDFNHPEMAQMELASITQGVEARCPVGAAFGVGGVGEGVVYRCVTPGFESPKFWFKVKGEKHSTTKVRTLAAVDAEAYKSTQDFVDRVVTVQRCTQGIDKLREAGKPTTRASLGDWLRWVYGDVVKEESDTAAASGLDIAKLGAPISRAAKKWFFGHEDSFVP